MLFAASSGSRRLLARSPNTTPTCRVATPHQGDSRPEPPSELGGGSSPRTLADARRPATLTEPAPAELDVAVHSELAQLGNALVRLDAPARAWKCGSRRGSIGPTLRRRHPAAEWLLVRARSPASTHSISRRLMIAVTGQNGPGGRRRTLLGRAAALSDSRRPRPPTRRTPDATPRQDPGACALVTPSRPTQSTSRAFGRCPRQLEPHRRLVLAAAPGEPTLSPEEREWLVGRPRDRVGATVALRSGSRNTASNRETIAPLGARLSSGADAAMCVAP